MIKRILLGAAVTLTVVPACADENTEYCQQLVNTLSAQRTQAEDSLAVVTARLSLAQKQIADLMKQLEEAKKEKPHDPQ